MWRSCSGSQASPLRATAPSSVRMTSMRACLTLGRPSGRTSPPAEPISLSLQCAVSSQRIYISMSARTTACRQHGAAIPHGSHLPPHALCIALQLEPYGSDKSNARLVARDKIGNAVSQWCSRRYNRPSLGCRRESGSLCGMPSCIHCLQAPARRSRDREATTYGVESRSSREQPFISWGRV